MQVILRLEAKPLPEVYMGKCYVELYTFASQVYARLVDEMGFVHDDNIGECKNEIDTYQASLKWASKYI